MRSEADIRLVEELVERIRPILAGHPPHVQGAVLADCLAIYIAGHYPLGVPKMQALLEHHITAARRLIPLNVKLLERRQEQCKNSH